MTTTELENQIVARLKEVLPPTVIVEGFPSNPGVYEVKAATGAALVRYQGSRFSSSTAASQRRDMEIVVVVGARSLRAEAGHRGAYDLLDATREALTGHVTVVEDYWEHTWAPTSEGFVLEKNNIWWFQVTFRAFEPYPLR